jgi:hypothetical protein
MSAIYEESAVLESTSEVPLAHVSVELGHLYPEDLLSTDLDRFFARVAPWARRERVAALVEDGGERRPRISTCLLVDDYSGPAASSRRRTPAAVIGPLVDAASRAGVTIDYLARESGLVDGTDGSLAELVEAQLVADPPFGADGSRPPVTETGWLTNGQRSPASGVRQAMGGRSRWSPPAENARHLHSIFLDVELWSGSAEKRVWSCSYLAAVWQLARLGVLRRRGARVLEARPVDLADLPGDWAELPTVVQVSRNPAPFSAYRTLSVLDSRFLPVENAVRTILSQVSPDPWAAAQTVRRAAAEGIGLPAELPERLSYVLLGP